MLTNIIKKSLSSLQSYFFADLHRKADGRPVELLPSLPIVSLVEVKSKELIATVTKWKPKTRYREVDSKYGLLVA
jgi:hypothetical protein